MSTAKEEGDFADIDILDLHLQEWARTWYKQGFPLLPVRNPNVPHEQWYPGAIASEEEIPGWVRDPLTPFQLQQLKGVGREGIICFEYSQLAGSSSYRAELYKDLMRVNMRVPQCHFRRFRVSSVDEPLPLGTGGVYADYIDEERGWGLFDGVGHFPHGSPPQSPPPAA
eukprot:5514368-Prymnesium_polylepis.1